MLQDEKRGVEEAYQVAGNTSDLRVEGDVRGDADLIIAAGWSDSRVGMALLRLHSEWDKAEKPRKPSPKMVEALAASLHITRSPAYVINQDRMEDHLNHMRMAWCQVTARRMAQDWYMAEMAKLVNKLKSLTDVRRVLIAYVPKWGIQEAAVKVPAVIAYWLDQTCHHCHGLKFTQIANTPALSTKACRPCGGTGIAAVPYHQEGRRVANYMDDCVQKARTSIRNRLHSGQTGWEKTGTRYTGP